MSLLGAFTDFAGNAAAQAVNNYYNTEQSRLNATLANNNARAAYQRSVNFYNQYQSPEAMLRQYREAGLSPSMMFSTGGGASGGLMGNSSSGAAGPSAPQMKVDPMGASNAEEQNELIRAQKENVEADTEGKEIDNAGGDPRIGRFLEKKNERIDNARKVNTDANNSACNTLQQELTKIGVFSEGTTVTWSHSEGSSEGNGGGITISQSQGDGHSDSWDFNFNVAANASVGLMSTGGGGSVGGGGGKSHSENQNTSDAWGVQWSQQKAKEFMDSGGQGINTSGNRRQAEDVLEKFFFQIWQNNQHFEAVKKNAENTYDYQCEHYTTNRQKWHSRR